MERALHDPEHGYYSRRIRGVGRRGDFSTTPTLSPVLGKAVAAWAVAAMRRTGTRNLSELGPGSGELAATVWQHLPVLRRMQTRMHLVEISEPLRKEQADRLKGRAQWHESLEAALDSCGGEACIYSNEFFDAFPVRRFRRRADGWEEQWVRGAESAWFPATDLPDSTIFDHDWQDGQIVEVHESVHDWMSAVLPAWRKGRMLTIDYGSESPPDLYHRRPGGTLRGYFHHQLVEGEELLQRVGLQDLTADICFSDLQRWAGDQVVTVNCVPQSKLLSPHAEGTSEADRFLSGPQGAGAAFLCMDQERRS